MVLVAEEIEPISFNAPAGRKRLARMLAAKWGLPDLSALMNEVLQAAIDSEFDGDTQEVLLRERRPTPKKARRRRPGDSDEQDKAA